MDAVKRELTVVYQKQLVWFFANNLSAQLAADAAACPGDHDHLARQVLSQQLWIGGHRLSAKYIFNVQLLKVGDGDSATGQVGQPRQGANPYR